MLNDMSDYTQVQENRFMSAIQRHTFWISLLAHCLLWSGFSFVWLHPVDDERRPSLYIPSYIKSAESIAQPTPVQPNVPLAKPQEEVKKQTQKKQTSKNGIEKKAQAAKTAQTQSRSAPAQFQAIHSDLDQQGVHLIGDEKIEKSLRTILGRAIASHLYYPENAIRFNVTGTVLVGFTLHPDGTVTDVQLVKPSTAGMLNAAALSAIKDMSPVANVMEYVPAARFLVVGIIFS